MLVSYKFVLPFLSSLCFLYVLNRTIFALTGKASRRSCVFLLISRFELTILAAIAPLMNNRINLNLRKFALQ